MKTYILYKVIWAYQDKFLQRVRDYILLKCCEIAKLPSKKVVAFSIPRPKIWQCLFHLLSLTAGITHLFHFCWFIRKKLLSCFNFHLFMHEVELSLYIFVVQCISFSVNYIFMSFVLHCTLCTSNFACLFLISYGVWEMQWW